MKKIIISSIIGLIFISALSYQAYVIYQLNKKMNAVFGALNFLISPDKDGITGFDKGVIQTINKMKTK